MQQKIEAIASRLAPVPLQVFISSGSGKYRKPLPGMWEHFSSHENGTVEIDLNGSFFVGDAAGRKKATSASSSAKKSVKGDHSCADRLFAINIGIQFYTPEEIFLDRKAEPFEMPLFDPRNVINNPPKTLFEPNTTVTPPINGQNEMIVIVGFPASGKSTFVEDYLIPKGFIHINRDNLKSWQKCVKECEQSLSKGFSVVIDNTNPDRESRQRYILCAKKVTGVRCRCFVMNVSYEQAKHNNKFRQLCVADKEHKDVNEMIINAYKAKFEQPNLAEGFDEIVNVNFIPKFNDCDEKKLYGMFLLER